MIRKTAVKLAVILAAFTWPLRSYSESSTAPKPFQAAVALLAHDASQGFITPQDQNTLMQSLLAVSDGNYAGWIKTYFVPALRKTLSTIGIPAPNGASWNDNTKVSDKEVLLWTVPGRSAYVEDSEVFPAGEQVRIVRDLLRSQRIDENDMDALINALAYARVILRMPPHIRILLPDDFITNGRGALLAPLEAAVHHDRFIRKENRFPVVVLWTVYDYDTRPEVILGGVPEYIAEVHHLAYEAVKEPDMKDALVAALKNIVPETTPRKGSDLTEQSRHAALLKYVKDQNPFMALTLLTPEEQFKLGLAIVDTPHAKSLKGYSKIKEIITDLQSRDASKKSLKTFKNEVDAYLQAGGQPSQAADAHEQDQIRQIEAARKLRTNILIMLAIGMAKEGIPASQAEFLLPKAVEFLKMKAGPAGLFSEEDVAQEAILKTLNQLPNRARQWLGEFGPEGTRDGEPVQFGLGRRGLDHLAYKPSLLKPTPGNLRRTREITISFPADFEVALRTYKHGTFRLLHDEKDDGYYAQLSRGDEVSLVLSNHGSHRKFAKARVDSIEKKKIGELTLDELRTEVDPARRFESRERLTDELIHGLQSFYGPDVSREMEGYMIIFHLTTPPSR